MNKTQEFLGILSALLRIFDLIFWILQSFVCIPGGCAFTKELLEMNAGLMGFLSMPCVYTKCFEEILYIIYEYVSNQTQIRVDKHFWKENW